MPKGRTRRTPWLAIGVLLLVAAVGVGAVETTRNLNRLERTVGGTVVYVGYTKFVRAVERSPWTLTLALAGGVAVAVGLAGRACGVGGRPRRHRRARPTRSRRR
ncbi:MAG: hypothetical protein AMXMBFR77_11600 [Phycisphaerales bacterium]|nr:hypothetical protein [Phycisphaerales bacterium]MDL1905571.1 hypothetical protein [Synechococcales cyanobacterium CNB]GIK18372.1 MAG: hypothetical protein BroJett004_05360 [Planctomycetota bacterium]